MWFRRNREPEPRSLVPFGTSGNQLFSKEFEVAKANTDHTTGIGLVAITGRYDSKKDSFRVESSYSLGSSTTAHANYGVTDEQILSVGLGSRFRAFGRRATVDLEYVPHSDDVSMKLSVRRSRVKVAGTFNFDNIKANLFREHSEKYELDARLNRKDSVKMAFNAKNNSAKIKFLRKLDPRNRVDVEYVYSSPSRRFVTMCFNHFYSKRHSFALTANYGSKKYKLEWDCKTNNGPWTISTDFSFNKSPHIGEWHITRRFEF